MNQRTLTPNNRRATVRLRQGVSQHQKLVQVSHHNAQKSTQSPSERLNITAFKGGGQSCFWQFPSLSVPIVHFEVLPCGLPTQAPLCPCSNDRAQARAKATRQVAAAAAQNRRCPAAPAPGPGGLRSVVAKLDAGSLPLCFPSSRPP